MKFPVQVSVDIESVVRSQVHPILDNRNNTIMEPNSFEVNTSIQRCLAKAIALHGLGLYIFAGEDLPEGEPLSEEQTKALRMLASGIEDAKIRQGVLDAMDNNTIDVNNFDMCIEHCQKIINKEKEKKNG